MTLNEELESFPVTVRVGQVSELAVSLLSLLMIDPHQT